MISGIVPPQTVDRQVSRRQFPFFISSTFAFLAKKVCQHWHIRLSKRFIFCIPIGHSNSFDDGKSVLTSRRMTSISAFKNSQTFVLLFFASKSIAITFNHILEQIKVSLFIGLCSTDFSTNACQICLPDCNCFAPDLAGVCLCSGKRTEAFFFASQMWPMYLCSLNRSTPLNASLSHPN